jgi:YwiC-like protein
MATATVRQSAAHAYVPREHGATAMMLTPFFCAAILLRHVYWQEAVALVAIVVALVIKDPLVVIARQRWVWKQKHAETDAARRLVVIELLLLAAAGATLLLTRDWRPLAALFIASAAFTALAVAVNVQNRQRSVWFQVMSAVALSGTSIAACLAGPGKVPAWGWVLWALCALQATAGIFVVHARLDARIASRKGEPTHSSNRGAALAVQLILLLTAVAFATLGRFWIAAALAVAATCYWIDLRRQQTSASLQMSLKSVGQQALTLSIAFAILIIIGLW